MPVNRSLILIVLASLTVCFLGAAYALWFNPAGLPLVGADGMETPDPAAVIGIESRSNGVKFTIDQTGIAAVSAAQLRAAGLEFESLDSENLSLTYRGRPLPFWVRGEEDEATLYFYAEAESDPQAPLAVFELRQAPGLAMQERNAQPFNEGLPAARHSLNWQERGLFVDKGEAGEAWMGPLLLAPAQWILHLDAITPDGGAASMAVDLYSEVETTGDEQHHVQFIVNDMTVAEHLWQGAGRKRVRIPLAAGVLERDRENQLMIVVHDDTAPAGDAIHIDGVELAYEGPIDVTDRAVTFVAEAPNIRVDGAEEGFMVFDISTKEAPVALTSLRMDGDSAQFAAGTREPTLIALNPSEAIKPLLEAMPQRERSLLADDWGADYIAIVANVRGFNEAIAPLLTHRQEEGMRVATISVEQIFDEFSYGHRDPQAIKDFIEHAVNTWAPPGPQFVLLVGDATYDVTNRISGKNRNRLPTPIIHAGEASGYVASDGWYANDENGIPRVAIGRFPAQNAPQLTNMVSKTIAYEATLAEGDQSWRQEALVVADDEPYFDETAVNLAAYLDEGGYDVYRLHMSYDDRVRNNILSAINQGVGLVSYVGHGSESNWGDEAVFQSSDAQTLYNGGRLPIFDTFTCRNGFFADPRNDSLAESLLQANGGGIVAAVAPSGSIPELQQLPLTMLFHEQIMAHGPQRLGERLVAMYEAVEKTPALRQALAPVNLLGDPALKINLTGEE
jgi:hypothetical protein